MELEHSLLKDLPHIYKFQLLLAICKFNLAIWSFSDSTDLDNWFPLAVTTKFVPEDIGIGYLYDIKGLIFSLMDDKRMYDFPLGSSSILSEFDPITFCASCLLIYPF